MYHKCTQEVYTKLMGERIRKVLVVYGAALVTEGAKEEGDAISTGIID